MYKPVIKKTEKEKNKIIITPSNKLKITTQEEMEQHLRVRKSARVWKNKKSYTRKPKHKEKY